MKKVKMAFLALALVSLTAAPAKAIGDNHSIKHSDDGGNGDTPSTWWDEFKKGFWYY